MTYTRWFEGNALWNEKLVEIKESPLGGLGVFLRPEAREKAQPNTVLLRVPKENVLALKNSILYNLVVDYRDSHVGELDLSEGMPGLILAFIHEASVKEASPWYYYINAILPEQTKIDPPLSLWTEEQKDLLSNTECGVLGMMNLDELVVLFEECIKFYAANNLVSTPEVFDIQLSNKNFETYKAKLEHFGRLVQSVVSRSFEVDDFLGPCLVPGADLFNHLSPCLVDGEVVERENVHFVCDGDVCEECGEQQCDHMDGQSDSEGQSDMEMEESEEESGDEESQEGGESQEDGESQEGGESQGDEENGEEGEGSEDEEEEDVKEITMEMIEQLENESDSDDENESDSDSDDENDDDESGEAQGESLLAQLEDSSRCVDIVLLQPGDELLNPGDELFNTYGNELSSAYLLQRYGFVCPGNINDTVTLSTQLLEYVKLAREKSTSRKAEEMDQRLQWLEENFEKLCEAEEDAPERWEFGIRVRHDGTITPLSHAILNVLNLPFKQFTAAKPKKLLAEKPENVSLVKNWCKQKLANYKPVTPIDHRTSAIAALVASELTALQNCI